MNIPYAIIKPFEPFGMPQSNSIKNSILLQNIIENIELIFGGACAAWRLRQLNIEKDGKRLIDDAESWMRLSLEQIGAKTVLPKLRQMYNRKGDNIGFTMMVNFRLPNDPTRRAEYLEYVHGHDTTRASTAKTHQPSYNRWPY